MLGSALLFLIHSRFLSAVQSSQDRAELMMGMTGMAGYDSDITEQGEGDEVAGPESEDSMLLDDSEPTDNPGPVFLPNPAGSHVSAACCTLEPDRYSSQVVLHTSTTRSPILMHKLSSCDYD